jgi:hypothetical protein
MRFGPGSVIPAELPRAASAEVTGTVTIEQNRRAQRLGIFPRE